MLLSIPLAAMLTLALAPDPAPDGGAKAAAVAPILGEDVAVVVRFDLARWDVEPSLRSVLGKLADEEDVRDRAKFAGNWVGSLQKAGAKELFFLIDPADVPGPPVVAVPLAGGVDAKALTAVFLQRGPGSPVHWPACEEIRGAVVAGSPGALARIRGSKPPARPELAAALAAGGDAPIQVAIIPSATQRRAVEEALPTLPPPVGGGAITTVTRGALWASITLAFEPKPAFRAVVQAKDADAAKALQEIAQKALKLLAAESRDHAPFAELSGAIGELKPKAEGDRITLEPDLEKTVALLAVPVRQAREAARRSQCTNNLKQIALAMHNYHSAHNSFPAAFSASKDGKPLLSWRVHILPYLEANALYEKFHLDEPWDSDHNKALISQIPRTYVCPSGGRSLPAEGKTGYLTFRGAATLFPGAQGIKLQDVTDGTSNTILVVDAGDAAAVPWTKPADWEFPPALKTQGLFGHHPNGTNFAFADGSVRLLKDTIALKVLQALITRNGGEVVSSDDF